VGIAFIANSHVENDVRAGLLSSLRLADVRIARDLALVFRKDKALSRAALAFIEIAVKQKTPQMAGAPK
jgi:DNA-binding transcriptional LysR family regulator